MDSGRLLIAIDGTASSGKGTLARRLGEHYRLPHLDTGLLYRAVGRRMLDAGHDLGDAALAEAAARAFDPAWLDDPRLRTAEAGVAASRVAAVHAAERKGSITMETLGAACEKDALSSEDIATLLALVKKLGIRIIETDPALSPSADTDDVV